MRILGIESSCDETAISIVEDGHKILSNVVVSQIDIFAAYGGVIPEIAARSHLEAIMPVLHQAFKEAGLQTEDHTKSKALDDWSKIDTIAVTHTPGLLGSLLVGTLTARTLTILHHKPLYAVHHLKSHIYANWLTEKPEFPLLALVISGGHTQIIRMKHHNHFEIIASTRDDAVGECFDKIAKILGLPYPGGPAISNLAKSGNPHRFTFPHPLANSLDFSFSGLKTAFLRTVQNLVNVPISYPSSKLAELLDETTKADLAASFDQAVTDILLEKITAAIKQNPETKSLVIAGGVSANQTLREDAKKLESKFKNLKCYFPLPKFSGDNAAMVASAAYYEILSGVKSSDPYKLNILPRSEIK